MKTKYDFKAHIINNLLVYLFVLLLMPTISYFIIEAKTSPKSHEKFIVFIAEDLNNEHDLKSELKELFKSDISIKVESHKTSENLFQTYVDTYGHISDILIFPKSYLDTIDNFTYRNFEIDNSYYSDTNYIKYEKHFGLDINNSLLLDYISCSKEESYYLLIGPNSVHTLDIFDDGKTNQISRFLNKYYNN